MGKLWRLPEASMLRVEHFEGGGLNGVDYAARDLAAAPRKRFRLRDRVLDHLRLLDHIAVFFFVGIGDTEQHAPKAGTPVAIRGWKIRSAIERLAIWSEERGERPSALPADRLHRCLKIG